MMPHQESEKPVESGVVDAGGPAVDLILPSPEAAGADAGAPPTLQQGSDQMPTGQAGESDPAGGWGAMAARSFASSAHLPSADHVQSTSHPSRQPPSPPELSGMMALSKGQRPDATENAVPPVALPSCMIALRQRPVGNALHTPPLA